MVHRAVERAGRGNHLLRIQKARSVGRRVHLSNRFHNPVSVAEQRGGLEPPLLLKESQDRRETGATVCIPLGKVRAREDRPKVRRQEHAHRPPAMPAREHHRGGHVDFIEVRPLLPIHLDRHEVQIERLRDCRVLEALVLHHVAPMAGGIADAQKDQLVFASRPFERLGAPREPVHRVIRVLEEVGARLPRKPIGHDSKP